MGTQESIAITIVAYRVGLYQPLSYQSQCKGHSQPKNLGSQNLIKIHDFVKKCLAQR